MNKYLSVILLALLMLIALLVSCTSSKKVYLPAENISIERDTVTTNNTVRERDTVTIREIRYQSVRDSMAPNLDSTGRVTGWNYWHWSDTSAEMETKLRSSRDSIALLQQRLSRQHTVKEPYPVEVTVEVPAKIPWYIRWLAGLGVVALISILITLLPFIRRQINRI
ncbi:MAG: hypothetical protein K2H86_09535 [Muribaculaceae bacterium]|nr:hypothetical protein [Muribaculaceae bacterium]